MQIKITEFFTKPVDGWAVCGSVITHGHNVAQLTWNAALNEAKDLNLLDTEEKRHEFRHHMENMGFSEAVEMQSWSLDEHNALFIQLIEGDVREGFNMEASEGMPEDHQWAMYEADAENGGRLFKGDDGEIYYYLGE